jgi:hypothetical protein
MVMAVPIAVRQLITKVLDQFCATVNTHDLHPIADTEDWHIWCGVKISKQGEVRGLTRWINHLCL